MSDQHKLSRIAAGPLESLGRQDAWQTTDGKFEAERERSDVVFPRRRDIQVGRQFSHPVRGFGLAYEASHTTKRYDEGADEVQSANRNQNRKREYAEQDPGLVSRASSGSRRLLPIFSLLAALAFGSAAVVVGGYVLKFRADWYVSISHGTDVAYFEQKCAVLSFEARVFSLTSTLDYLARNNCPAVETQARAEKSSFRHPSMSGSGNSYTFPEKQPDISTQAQ